MLPIAVASFIAMWILFFTALIFFKEGDDKRTLLLIVCLVLAILSGFSLMLPNYATVVYPQTITFVESLGSNIIAQPYNATSIDGIPSNPEIALYSAFAVLMGIVFAALALWSFKKRLEYKTTQQFQAQDRRIKSG